MAFDAAANGGSGFSLTTAGVNRIIVIAVYVRGAGGSCTGASYNTVAATNIKSVNDGSSDVSLWYLLAPTTGAHTVTYTTSGSVFDNGAAVSLQDMIQAAPEANNGSSSASTTTISDTITTVAGNANVVDMLGIVGVVTGPPAPQGSQINKTSNFAGNAPIAMSWMAEPSGGSHSYGWDRNDSNNNYMGHVVASFAPIPTPIPPGSPLLMMGVG